MAAEFSPRAKYAHRYNRDGTTDSICKECFMTVAKAIWEADLERAERVHQCESRAVAHFRKMVTPEARPAVLPWRIIA